MIEPSLKSKALMTDIEDRCIQCHQCKNHCKLLDDVYDYDHFKETFVREDVPYQCHLCSHCQSVCPLNIDFKPVFFSLRKDALAQKKQPKSIAVDFHQKQSFSPWLSSTPKKAKRVFFPGCALTAHDPVLVEKLYHDIKTDDMDIWMSCCGSPTHFTGKDKIFNHQNAHLKEVIEAAGIEEVIVACQNCYRIFESHDVKITSVYEIIADKDLAPICTTETMALHDPCPTRHVTAIHDSVRSILEQLNVTYSEFKLNKEKTQCCGSGAMVPAFQYESGIRQMKNRANQTDEEVIVTYCQECVQSMQTGGKKSFHILDLIYHDVEAMGYNQKNQNTLKQWINRFQFKIKADRIR